MRFEHLGLAPDLVDYMEAWEYQRVVHAKVVAGELENTTLLLEHSPVYTAGKMTQPFERPFDGTPVVDVDRGGKITWHGPGQLVGYPIVRLAAPINVVGYVRLVEEIMIRTAAEFGVVAERVEGRSGVWILGHDDVPDRKLGAIGIRVSKQVTMHGFALNVCCDLAWSQTCIPCGITDAGVTTLSQEAGRPVTVAEVLPVAERHISEVLATISEKRTPAVATA